MAARLARILGWPLDVVKRHSLRELRTMVDLLNEEDRQRRIAAAHRKARKGR